MKNRGMVLGGKTRECSLGTAKACERKLNFEEKIARGQGFEPRFPGPEPGVLPLDDPRIVEK